MTTRRHVTNAGRGAISVSLVIVLALVAIGLVVAGLGVALGFAAGGDDSSAVEHRVAALQKKVDAANTEFLDSATAIESKAAQTAEIANLADQMVANENQALALFGQFLAAVQSGDRAAATQAVDQLGANLTQHNAIEDQLAALVGAQ